MTQNTDNSPVKLPVSQQLTDNDNEVKPRSVKVIFEDGNFLFSTINATMQQAVDYYVGQRFQFGDTDEHPADKMVKCTDLHFLDVEDKDGN